MGITVVRGRLEEWPGPFNTGVPAGTSLTNQSGNLTINTPGTIVEDTWFTNGSIHINGVANVTIRRCKITNTDALGILISGGSTNALIEDCEITCNNFGGSHGIGQGSGLSTDNIRVRRCNIYDVENGFDIDGGMDIRDCWVHDLNTAVGAHSDGIQFAAGADNITIHHNFIDAKFPQNGTSAIHPDGSLVNSNIYITYNKLWGGAATVYMPTVVCDNYYVNYNRLRMGEFFYFSVDAGTTWTEAIGNVDDITGANVDP